jgi:hypothetical protein
MGIILCVSILMVSFLILVLSYYVVFPSCGAFCVVIVSRGLSVAYLYLLCVVTCLWGCVNNYYDVKHLVLTMVVVIGFLLFYQHICFVKVVDVEIFFYVH